MKKFDKAKEFFKKARENLTHEVVENELEGSAATVEALGEALNDIRILLEKILSALERQPRQKPEALDEKPAGKRRFWRAS